MRILIIINDAPYGTEKAYNAFRFGYQIIKDHSEAEINLILLSDGVGCGLAGQETPKGYYNTGLMMKSFLSKGGKVKACGSCMDARGISENRLLKGATRGSMEEFARWTVEADKVINF